MSESPRQLLLRKATEYRDRQQLLEAIATTAQPTQDGCYLVDAGLIERLKSLIQAA